MQRADGETASRFPRAYWTSARGSQQEVRHGTCRASCHDPWAAAMRPIARSESLPTWHSGPTAQAAHPSGSGCPQKSVHRGIAVRITSDSFLPARRIASAVEDGQDRNGGIVFEIKHAIGEVARQRPADVSVYYPELPWVACDRLENHIDTIQNSTPKPETRCSYQSYASAMSRSASGRTMSVRLTYAPGSSFVCPPRKIPRQDWRDRHPVGDRVRLSGHP